jgi:hypothetical protein
LADPAVVDDLAKNRQNKWARRLSLSPKGHNAKTLELPGTFFHGFSQTLRARPEIVAF